jgi:hypothetical protein
MKYILVIALLFSTAAHAQLSNQAHSIANMLSRVESQLHPRDAEEIRYNLQRTARLLERYGRVDGPSELICLSNGESGVWEKFYLYDAATNSRLGGATKRETCESLRNSARNSLICLSNGESGVWEKFTPYDLRAKANTGGATQLNTCQTLTERSTMNFMCISNGESGVWEKFTLYNRIQRSSLGGQTSLEGCMSSMPGMHR